MAIQAETTPRVKKPSAFSRHIANISYFLSISAVFIMFISVIFEVLGRSFFGHATIWVTEVSTYLVVAITFFGAAFVAESNANVRVDIFLERLPLGLKEPLLNALAWISVQVSVIVVWKTTSLCIESFESGARSWSLLNAPLWVPQLAVVVGMIGMALVLATQQTSKTGGFGFLPALFGLLYAVLDGTHFATLSMSPLWTFGLISGFVLLSVPFVSGGRSLGCEPNSYC